MFSREIAELTENVQPHVLADINSMLERLELISADLSSNLQDVYGRSHQGGDVRRSHL